MKRITTTLVFSLCALCTGWSSGGLAYTFNPINDMYWQKPVLSSLPEEWQQLVLQSAAGGGTQSGNGDGSGSDCTGEACVDPDAGNPGDGADGTGDGGEGSGDGSDVVDPDSLPGLPSDPQSLAGSMYDCKAELVVSPAPAYCFPRYSRPPGQTPPPPGETPPTEETPPVEPPPPSEPPPTEDPSPDSNEIDAPATVGLFGLGLIGLVYFRRRRLRVRDDSRARAIPSSRPASRDR